MKNCILNERNEEKRFLKDSGAFLNPPRTFCRVEFKNKKEKVRESFFSLIFLGKCSLSGPRCAKSSM